MMHAELAATDAAGPGGRDRAPHRARPTPSATRSTSWSPERWLRLAPRGRPGAGRRGRAALRSAPAVPRRQPARARASPPRSAPTSTARPSWWPARRASTSTSCPPPPTPASPHAPDARLRARRARARRPSRSPPSPRRPRWRRPAEVVAIDGDWRGRRRRRLRSMLDRLGDLEREFDDVEARLADPDADRRPGSATRS